MKTPFIAFLLCGVSILALTNCSSVRILSEGDLVSGKYQARKAGKPFEKVRLVVSGDSFEVYRRGDSAFTFDARGEWTFIQNNLDLDVMLAPFKYRPAQPSLPRQLNNSFNANLFLGYRLDRFRVRFHENGNGPYRSVRHSSLGVGVFGGISALIVTPWTTNYQTMDEYSGLGISRGFMLLGGLNAVTFGFAVGLDRLTDRDKNIWIYQNRPWYGLTIGLNIN